MKKFFLVTAFVLLNQIDVYSCICSYYPLKDQYKEADIIFIGQVIEGPFYYENEDYYKFEVSKFYKGEVVDTIIITTPFVCGYSFNPGETYLVYAYGGEIYSTTLCTRTKKINDAGTDLHFLNNLPHSLESSGIAGKVFYFEFNFFNKYALPPMSNYSFTLQNDSLQFLIECDSDGEFYADNIPPGHYNILLNEKMDVELKQSSSFYPEFELPELQIEISDSSLLEKTFILSKKNAVTGNIFDENDNPIKHAVINLMPEIYFADEENNFRYETFKCGTDSSGYFKFKNIPDGRYYLGINLELGVRFYSPYPVTFFRNAENRRSAELIEVRNGSLVEDVSFKVSKTFKTYQIKGTLEGDSIFWKYALVELYKTPEAKNEEKIASAGVGSTGTFRITTLEDTPGWLVFQPRNSSANVQKGIYPKTPEPVKIEPNKNYNDIIFKIETEQRTPQVYQHIEQKSTELPLQSKYKETDFIFTGKIMKMYPDTSDFVRYKIKVTKIFKGVKSDTLTIYYQSYPQHILPPGEEYLISGIKENGSYLVNPSGLTSIDEAAQDIAFLNAPPPPNPVLKGKVFFLRENNTLRKNFSFKLHNIMRDYTIKIDSTGSFSTTKVIPGIYQVIIDKSLIATHKNSLQSLDRIEISREDTLVNLDIIISSNNSIEGFVLDGNNKPLRNVRVDIYPDLKSWTDADGKFIFSSVSDGSYYLGINISRSPSADNPYSVTWYKNEADTSARGKIIDLKDGTKISGIILKPERIYKIQSINGRLIKPDGTPYINGTITLSEDQEGKKLLAGAINNNRTGGFRISSLEYMEGWLVVSPGIIKSEDNKQWRPVKPEPFRIEAGKNYEDIEIVIDPEKLESVEIKRYESKLPQPEKIIVPEKISDEKYFIPDESNYNLFYSLKYLFQKWYVSDEIDYEEHTFIYKSVKAKDINLTQALKFYPDGNLRMEFDSSHYIDLRWRMDIKNNSDIAVIAPNDTVMYIINIIELGENKLRIKTDGYASISVSEGKTQLKSFRFSGNTHVETVDITYKPGEYPLKK